MKNQIFVAILLACFSGTVFSASADKPEVKISEPISTSKKGNKSTVRGMCIDGYKFILTEGYNKKGQMVSSHLVQMYIRKQNEKSVPARC